MKRTAIIVAVLLALATSQPSAQGTIAGNWQGTVTLGANPPIRIGLIVAETTGGFGATLVIIDQDGARIPVQQTTLTGDALRLDIPNIGGVYEGTVNAAADEIAGAIAQQGGSIPITFRRVAALDPPPSFGERERADVAAVVNAYFQSFTANDFEAFASHLQAPFTRWPIGGSAAAVASVEEVVAGMRDARQALNGTEYAVSRAAEMIITPLSANSAMVDVHWRRDTADGTVFQEGAEILSVVRTPAGWKINGNVARALSHYRKVF